ncbi:MAG: DUF427 domain-containing protein [Bacteroidales bacterium]|nr:DUF427 domain-containing protein [Bacteroidales bacterium]
MKAIWNNKVIAESDDIVTLEGNSYFPAESVNNDLISKSDSKSVCPWKGIASYYDIHVDGKINKAAAWYYPEPKIAAKEIRGRVAFWKGVEILED